MFPEKVISPSGRIFWSDPNTPWYAGIYSVWTSPDLLLTRCSSKTREKLKNSARVWGCISVEKAGDGEKALRAYADLKPDFVTLDITMPNLNGIDALEKLVELYPDAKVIIVSAVGQKQLVFKALGLGAKDFIIKPFDPARVKQAVDRLFE